MHLEKQGTQSLYYILYMSLRVFIWQEVAGTQSGAWMHTHTGAGTLCVYFVIVSFWIGIETICNWNMIHKQYIQQIFQCL